jgi:uncharacterized repeat protein (TIGR03803 family)
MFRTFIRHILLVILITLVAPATQSSAQTLTLLHAFNDTLNPNNGIGVQPFVQASDGNFYGLTSQGGVYGGGTIFRMAPSGAVTLLHSFNPNDPTEGNGPDGGLSIAPNGTLYGTTFFGGTGGLGTVFTVTNAGAVTILHEFSDGSVPNDGARPWSNPTVGVDGNFYGATWGGGKYGKGAFYELTPSGTVTILYSFGDPSVANDGNYPLGGPIQGPDGNFYGTTTLGGSAGGGTIYRMTASGSETILHSFEDGSVVNDGSEPYSALTLAADGNFYGTTECGGQYGGLHDIDGVAYQLTPTGTVTTIHSFGQPQTNSPDGASPSALVVGPGGDLYGSCGEGGTSTGGILFELTLSGSESILWSFPDTYWSLNGPNLYGDPSAVIFGTDGNMYGPLLGGSPNGAGNIFRLSNTPTVQSPVISPTGASTGPVQATITNSQPGSTIYYTTDGTTPTTSSTVYSGASPITVSTSETIQAIAVQSGYLNSPIVYGYYFIGQTVPTPTISPSGGTFNVAQTVTLADSQSGASIYYTTDGSTPTTSSNLYSNPFTVSSTTTINAIAVQGGYFNSGVVSATLTVVQPPAISPNGGTFTSLQMVTLSDSLPGVTLYYTLDGSTPTSNSILYTAPFGLAYSKTVNAIAVANGTVNSLQSSATFTETLPTLQPFGTGLQMISLPYSYPGVSLDSIFGYTGVKLGVWNDSAYAITPTAPANTIVPGQGYWIRLPSAFNMAYPGTPAPTNAPFVINLQPGWNMVGDPFTSAISLDSLKFDGGTETFSEATTGSSALVEPEFWAYPSGATAYLAATSLVPGQGVWVYAFHATDMDVPSPG